MLVLTFTPKVSEMDGDGGDLSEDSFKKESKDKGKKGPGASKRYSPGWKHSHVFINRADEAKMRKE